jgi:nucleotide-binding universal stress UspA family protein
MFKKILVPLDGSDLAATILPQVEDLAKAMQAQVTLMTVEPLAK